MLDELARLGLRPSPVTFLLHFSPISPRLGAFHIFVPLELAFSDVALYPFLRLGEDEFRKEYARA
jgi:hypothetical protein